jgi:electron transport complex protein RnfD
MRLVFFCAGLAVIESAASDGGASLVVALAALVSAILTELLFTCNAHGFGKLRDGSAAASALVLTLLLPNQIHPAYAALAAAFAIAVVKHSFGGLGSNWLNPGLGGWLFVRFSWPHVFVKDLAGSPLARIASALDNGSAGPLVPPMELANPGRHAGQAGAFEAVRGFLNSHIFFPLGIEIPAEYTGMLASPYPGIIADRGVFALLCGTILLLAFQAGRAWIPAVFLGVFTLLVRIAGDLPFGGLYGNGDMLFAILSGGTLAGAFILACEPSSSAKSQTGSLCAVILGALLTFVFRYGGGEPYGCFFALALVNALTPLIRSLEGRCCSVRRQGHRSNRGAV